VIISKCDFLISCNEMCLHLERLPNSLNQYFSEVSSSAGD
jgi:hypothetical protein